VVDAVDLDGDDKDQRGAGDQWVPTGRVAGQVVAVAAGRGHSVVATQMRVWTHGANGHGQLGRPPLPAEVSAALAVDVDVSTWTGHPVCSVACGLDHTLVLTGTSVSTAPLAASAPDVGAGTDRRRGRVGLRLER
jgi:alpha-tubulin suppressor-like RCC1 family protein